MEPSRFREIMRQAQYVADHWEEIKQANPILIVADDIIEAIYVEETSMDTLDYFRMELDQRKDPEWQAINKISPLSRSDSDMMDWVIHTMGLRLAWIRRWKRERGL